MAYVFTANDDGTYDLILDGRAREYDVGPEDLGGAVRRARIDPTEVWVEDSTGHRTRLGR